jgi:PAS domain S-box-containing protein
MQNIDRNLTPEVKSKIESILAQHKISAELSTQKQTNIKRNYNLIESEIKIDPSKTIMSKTDKRGIIEYANDYFMEVSGYEEHELMGQSHNIIRHPDMPKVIFKELWRRLKNGKNIYAIVKNKAKDGRYYWVLTSFETKYDADGNITSHYAKRKAVPSQAIFYIEKVYKTLRAIEKNQSLEVAEKYFKGMLEEKHMNYDQFILAILNTDSQALSNYFQTKKQKKKGVISRLFSK